MAVPIVSSLDSYWLDRYVSPAHHMSGSTSSFTTILHFASSLPVLADAGERKDGSLASVAQ